MAYKHCGVVLEDTTLRMTTKPSRCRGLHSPKHFCCLGKHISRFSSSNNWQPNNWLKGPVTKLITAIICQHRFYPQNSYQTLGPKAAKVNQTKSHLQYAYLHDDLEQIYGMPKNLHGRIPLPAAKCTKKVHLNWLAFLVEALPPASASAFLPKLAGWGFFIFLK